MSCPKQAKNDPYRLEPATNTDTDRYDITDIQEGVEEPSHDLAFSRLSQQDSMNGEPSCNHELSQNDQPNETEINNETNITIPDNAAVPPESKDINLEVQGEQPLELRSLSTGGEIVYQLKVVFLGDGSVGKTSLITRFMYNSYGEPSATIGSDILIKTISLGSKKVKLELWDTAGQERFQSIVSTHIKKSSIAVVVYDITDRKSFDAVDGYIRQVREERHDNVVILIVGNKVDLQDKRQIKTTEGERKATELKADFGETSAKTGCNVKDLLTRVVLSYIDMWDNQTSNHQGEHNTVQLTSANQASVILPRRRRFKCPC